MNWIAWKELIASQGLGGDADATAVEGLHRHLEPLALLAEEVFGGNAAVLEDQLHGRRGADAELLLLLAESKAGGVFFDDEGADAMMLLGLPVGAGQNDIGFGVAAVGDKDLAAVDHPLIAVAHGGGLGPPGIGAGRVLGEAEGAELAPFGEGFEELLLLLLGAEEVDRVGAQRQVSRESHPGGGADPRELLDGDGVADVVGLGAAVRLGKDDPRQAQLAELVVHQGAVEALRLVALGDAGGDLGLGEFPHHLPHQVVFFGQLKNHRWSPLSWLL